MTDQRIVVEIDDAGVATATLNRADKHNALDPAMFDALIDVTGTLAQDKRVRAVVVHGAGKSFCSGSTCRVWGRAAAWTRCWNASPACSATTRSGCHWTGAGSRRR